MAGVNNDVNDESESNAKKNKRPKVIDGGWGWIVVFSSFMHNCLSDSVSFTFGIFYKDIQASFDDGSAKTQLLNSVFVGVALCTGPVSGVLINKFDCRRVAITGGAIFSLGLFLSTFSPNLDVMILLYGVVGGFGMGLVYTPSLVIVSNYFHKRRALATGIATCGSGFGSFVFAPVYELLLKTYGWRGAIWIVAGIVFHCVLFAISYRPLHFKRHGSASHKSGDEIDGEYLRCDTKINVTSQKSHYIVKFQRILQPIDIVLFTNAAFVFLLLSGFLTDIGVQIPYNFLPAAALENGLSDSDGALLISILSITSTLSMIIAGIVSDYPWADSILIYSVTLFIGGVATCLLPFFNNFSSLAIYTVVVGIPLGTCLSLPTIIMLEFLELERLPSAFGLLAFLMGIATIIGPPIAGLLEDMTGGYSAVFYFAGATFVLSGMTCIPVRLIIKYNKRRSDTNVTTTEVVEITHM